MKILSKVVVIASVFGLSGVAMASGSQVAPLLTKKVELIEQQCRVLKQKTDELEQKINQIMQENQAKKENAIKEKRAMMPKKTGRGNFRGLKRPGRHFRKGDDKPSYDAISKQPKMHRSPAVPHKKHLSESAQNSETENRSKSPYSALGKKFSELPDAQKRAMLAQIIQQLNKAEK